MKTNTLTARFSVLSSLVLLILVVSSTAYAGATITVVNVDGANEGFNDPTPVAPVGGNTGATRGQQRLIAFQFAANRWGETLDSNVQIFVQAAFNPLAANVLGSAGATFVFRDFAGVGLFPGASFPATWHSSSLADKRAGTDLNPGFVDIAAQFNSNFNFYLGLDNNHGPQVDLVTVVLHELGHGLGFQTFVNSSTGANLAGFTDTYARNLLDISNGLHWHEMTQAERQASATRFGRLVWDGATVTLNLPSVLSFGSPEVNVISPPAVAGVYQFGTAAFGPPLGSPSVQAEIVAALDPADAAGPATTDGCSPFTNAAAVAGKIALVERGTCGFAVKARNATDAGAAAVIIYNNAANVNAAPPGMADDGINGVFVTIPTVSMNRANALAILAASPGVIARIGVDPLIRAGADAFGRARLFAPFPVQGGSSISHFDSVAFRNLLMEPAINADLTHNLTAPDDLTLELLRDIGWFADADLDGIADEVDCSPNSDFTPTVVIGGCDSGVPNTLFSSGCTISDLIAQIAANARDHGAFVSGVAQLGNSLVANGVITQAQKNSIQSCAARARIP